VTSTFEPIATEMGEPFVSLFVPDEIEGLLRHHGFDDIAHFGPEQARAAWFSGAAGVAIAGAQRLIAATVSPVAHRSLNRESAKQALRARNDKQNVAASARQSQPDRRLGAPRPSPQADRAHGALLLHHHNEVPNRP